MSNNDTPEELYHQISRLKKQLSQTEQNYTNLLENIGDSLFIIDLVSHQIILTNEHATRRLGYAPNGLVGISLDDIEIINTNTEESAWESTFSGTRVYECHYRHRDGSLIPTEVSSRIVTMNGKPVIQNFARNITVRKQLQAERQQLIDDLNSFAYMVAHDIKNPLGLVVSYSQFIHDTFDTMTADELRQSLHFIYNNGQRTVSIVEELLLFASIQGEKSVDYAPLDTYQIVSEVVLRLAHMIENHKAQVVFPEHWQVALGYAPWVQEIWVNYISNAIKYGGTPPYIELGSALEPNGMVCFWVRDNGAGIDPQHINQLFTAFTRLSDLRVEGNGLGLSIVKRLTERQNGTVDASSDVGKGSIFRFYLPAYGG
jgi:PAS domain S-box-containing protein